ncbi:MAG: Uma2 family endonuclease [Acidimicrobiales bacterium]
MKTVVLDPAPVEVERLIERRRRLGLDGYDEVWEGVYHMAPMARFRHGRLQVQLARLVGPHSDAAGLVDSGPFNLGEGPESFRVPDLGYHRPGLDPDALYVPTAAIVVEVTSPGDETHDKLPFYSAHGVDEVWVVDPAARRVQMLARRGNGYRDVEASALLGVRAADLIATVAWP